ncbi:MAG TPA: type II secretion system protein [Candidatus Saccharimonadales bacterium]|nr:type II secretion system protein [Candidatus Saccharimonadales bacterium]
MSGACKARGFTLIELVLVIAIVGILAAAAIPAWFDRARTNLDITRRRLVGDLIYAREYAVLQHDHVAAKFIAGAGSSYSIYRVATGAALPDPSNTGGTLSFALNGAAYSGGVTIASADFGGTPGVRFNSWGTPCDSAGNVLAAIGLIRLSSGTYTDTIRVEPRTGFIR